MNLLMKKTEAVEAGRGYNVGKRNGRPEFFQIRYKLNAHGDMQPLRVPIRGVGVARDDEPPWP